MVAGCAHVRVTAALPRPAQRVLLLSSDPGMAIPTEFQLSDGSIDLVIDAHAYRLSAIKKAAYRLADRCTAVIQSSDADRCALSLRFKPGTSEQLARDTARVFFQELLDQELREQIAEETGSIRALILAHAFSKTDLIKRE